MSYINQEKLNQYFGKVWALLKEGVERPFNRTGYIIVDKVRESEWVLDVGCGKNLLKVLHPLIVGVDPAFDTADYKMTIEEYAKINKRKFDVAFSLGTINFGPVEIIENQIEVVISMLKPKSRIYWRCNPGLKDHGTKECEEIDFYPWSFEEHLRLAKKFGYEVKELKWEDDGINHSRRIYAEWVRNA
jgi:hypothetical protein